MQANNDHDTPTAQLPEHRPVRWGMLSLLISGALLAGIAAAVTWLLNDTARVKALTERAVSSLTGRSLSIRGAFDFELGREIRLSAEQLIWANAPWSSGPAMLSIDSAELVVDLRSILQPPLRITKFSAANALLNFEWNTAGESNWQLGAPASGANKKSQRTFEWLLQQADLQNVDLEILPPGQTEELHIHIQTLQQQSAADLYPGQEMTVSVTAISWTNPAWATEPNLLQIAAAEATFDFDSILQPPLVISDFTARDAQLDFEWDADGRFNGRIGAPDSSDSPESENPFPLLLDQANLQNVAVRIRHPSQSEALLIDVQRATQRQDASNHLVTDINAVVEGEAVDLHGRIGPFSELLRAGAVDFAVAANGPSSNLKLLGKVGKLADLQKPNFEFDWSAPEVEKVFEIFNITPAASGKAALRGFVTTGDAGIEGQLDGTIGEFAVSGSLQAENIRQLEGLSLSNLDGLKLNLQSTGPSARAAGTILTIDGLPPEPYELDVQLQDTAAGLQIDALRFATAGGVATGSGVLRDFPALDKLDLDLQVNVNNIARFSGFLPGKNIPALPLRMEGKISSNAAAMNDSVTASAKLGTMEAQLTGVLTENERFADSSFDWTLTVPDAQKSGAIFGIRLQQAVPLSASGKASLNTAGLGLSSTVVKLGKHAANLKGELPLSGENAALQLDGDLSGPDLGNLVNLFRTTDEIPRLPYKLATQLSYKEPKLELRTVSGTVGSNKLQASGTLTFGKDWPVTSLQVATEGPRFEELLQAQALENLPTGAYSASGDLQLSSGGTQISQLKVQTQNGLLKGSLGLGWPADPDRVDFDVTAEGTNLRASLPKIDSYEPAAVPFNIAAKGRLNKQQADIPQLVAKIGGAQIKLQGNLDFSSDLRADGATLQASGPRVSDLGGGDSWSLPESPFVLTAQLAGGAEKFELSDFSLELGPSDLRGSLQLTRSGKPRIEIVASSKLLDVRPFEQLFDSESVPATAAAAPAGAAKVSKKGERDTFIPETAIPLGQLNSVDGSLQLSAGKFITRRYPFENLNVKATLADGNLDFDGSSGFSNNGNIQVALQLQQPKGRVPHAEFSTTARNVQYELNQLDQSLQGYNLIQNIDAYLVGDGANLREIAANVNGYIWLRGGGQKIATNQFGFIFGDFLTGVINKINPFVKKEPYQNIQCVVAFFSATDGVLKTAPAALLATDKLNIGAAGTINLKNEKIALNVRADPRTGVGISASSLLNPFVGLRGTLSKPQLSLDPTGTLIDGGAAVATGGLSIVAESLYKRWFGSRDPCAKLADEARKTQLKRDPAHVPAD